MDRMKLAIRFIKKTTDYTDDLKHELTRITFNFRQAIQGEKYQCSIFTETTQAGKLQVGKGGLPPLKVQFSPR